MGHELTRIELDDGPTWSGKEPSVAWGFFHKRTSFIIVVPLDNPRLRNPQFATLAVKFSLQAERKRQLVSGVPKIQTK